MGAATRVQPAWVLCAVHMRAAAVKQALQLCHSCTQDGYPGVAGHQVLVMLCAGFDLKRSAKDLSEAKYLQSAGELPATRCASLVFSLSTLVLSNCTSGVV